MNQLYWKTENDGNEWSQQPHYSALKNCFNEFDENETVPLADAPLFRNMLRTRDTSTMIIFSDSNDDTEIVFTLESLTQAGIIFIMALAIVITNILIIATFLNFRGTFSSTYKIYKNY